MTLPSECKDQHLEGSGGDYAGLEKWRLQARLQDPWFHQPQVVGSVSSPRHFFLVECVLKSLPCQACPYCTLTVVPCWSLLRFIDTTTGQDFWLLAFLVSSHAAFCYHENQSSGRRHSDRIQFKGLWVPCLKRVVSSAVRTRLPLERNSQGHKQQSGMFWESLGPPCLIPQKKAFHAWCSRFLLVGFWLLEGALSAPMGKHQLSYLRIFISHFHFLYIYFQVGS